MASRRREASTDTLANRHYRALYARVVFVRRPGHGFGIVYGIDSEISKAIVIFFTVFDDGMSNFTAENEGAVCE